ncbi:MAG: TolC family protein, partial [Verrucomicrobia bacterium]|nr:TolC family protein [Verrucomicrobiota bacterium]
MKFSRPPIFLLLASAVLGTASFAHAHEAPATVAPSELVQEILSKNPEFAFYQAEIGTAKAGVRAAAAFNDPELSLDLGRKRVREANGTLAGEGTAWSVSVTQTFEWPGRIALRKAIANRQVELAELGLNRFRAALDARARTLSFGLYAANAKAAAVREVADRFAALKETFLARDPAGVTPLLETRVVEASELSLQRRATRAELEVQSALIELNQLRGAAADSPLRVGAMPLAFKETPQTDVLMNAARENNFDFKMRRVELEQQGYEVRLARNERHPAISVSPFYSQERAGDRETTVGVGLSIPLPVGGKTRSGVDVAEARRRQAEAAALVAQRELEREVLTSAHAYATKSAEARRWAPDAVKKFREAAELADRHYRLGAVPIATYVEMQNSYLEAVEALLETQGEALEAGL